MNRILIVMLLFLSFNCFANEHKSCMPHRYTVQEQKEFDKKLDDRLHLTQEQKDYIKSSREKYLNDVSKNISKMVELHKKIKEVYSQDIPKYQADIKTAGYKTELAKVSQEAMKQRSEHRKNFESILTKEQKEEFQKMKNERMQKRQIERNKHQNIKD